MANYGYQYINIDDGWMAKRGEPPYRGADGVVLPNNSRPQRPWRSYSCPRVEGGHLHLAWRLDLRRLRGGLWARAADIGQFARWGFDFLKYDLCGYKCILKDPNSREELIKPYKLCLSA